MPGLRVCIDCYDPKHPQEFLQDVTDPIALWKPAPDTVYLSPPALITTLSGNNVVLTWSGFNSVPQFESDDIPPADVGKTPRGSSSGANITAGYYVMRAPQVGGIPGTYVQIANILHTADEFGALVVETDTYTDTPGVGSWYYYVVGYDVLQNASYG